jgi:hypothetical protein
MAEEYKIDKRTKPLLHPADAGKLTAATMSRDLRQAAHHSLFMLDAVRYLMWVAKANPSAYLAFIGKALVSDDESSVGGLHITVQNLTVSPTATPGVLASPIEAHIAPQLKLVTEVT